MAFKSAQKIFEEREREAREKELQQVGKAFNQMVAKGTIRLHPSTEKKMQDFIDYDTAKRKREDEQKKKADKFGMILGILFFIVLVLGCVWLIKFFLGGILG